MPAPAPHQPADAVAGGPPHTARRRVRAGVAPVARRVSVALVVAALAGGLPAACGTPGSPDSPAARVEHGLVYARHGRAPLELDAYLPGGPRPAPAVVLVHGGGWVSGRRSGYRRIAPAFARAGIAAFSIDYTPCDAEHAGYPLQQQQVLAAVAWVRRHATALHVDGRRVGVMGDSAGAQLALAAATAEPNTGASPLQAAAGWSGPYDLPTFRPSPAELGGTGARLLTDLAWFTGCLPIDGPACLAAQAAASPARRPLVGAPPVLLATSDDYGPGCEIVSPDQTSAMAGALRSAGVPVQVDATDRCAHGLGYAGAELPRTLAFFARAFGTAPGPVAQVAQPAAWASTSSGGLFGAATGGRST